MPEITAGLDVTRGSHLKNLMTLSLPIMITNLMQTVYNLTDTFWLGRMGGEDARIGVSIAGIAFPIIFFFSSFCMGLVIAGTALISRYRGAKMLAMIKELVGQFSLVFALFAFFFIAIAIIFMKDVLILLQTPPEVFEIGWRYMNVTMYSVFFMFVYFAYQSFAHGLGDTLTPMKIQLATIILNIIIDPFLIFGWWGFPELGVLGAAYATFFCRFLTALIAVIVFFKKTPQFIPSLREMVPDFKIIRTILKISIPASISHSTISLGFLVLQGFVNTYGTIVISVHAIGNRIISIFMLPAMGLSQGLSSVVGQNLGANNIPRIKRSVRHTLVIIVLIMMIGGIIMYLWGAHITRVFINDNDIVTVSARMFRITAFAGTFFGILFVFIGVFNGAGKTIDAMMFNIARLWIFQVPLVYLLSGKLIEYTNIEALQKALTFLAAPLHNYPYDALWWSMLISNAIASIIAIIVYSQGNWKNVKIVQ